MSDNNKSYANFNVMTVQGRIFNAELVQNNGNEWLSVTVISTPVNDGDDFTVTFSNSNGLMGLHKKGWLPTGRQVTVTGHIASVSETYTDKTGETRMRRRPQIHLKGATILDGGLGPMPKEKMPSTAGQVVRTAPVDKTPTLEKSDF